MSTALATRLRPQGRNGPGRTVNHVLQIAIVTALVEGVRRHDPSVIVNGIVSLAFAAMPRYLETRYGARFHSWQRLWVSTAALVHTLGMLGPYDRIWWWDHLAHTLSGVVVAGATDVVFRAEVARSNHIALSPDFRPAAITGVTLGFGFFWEALEYIIHAIAERQGLDPLLVHYGRRDAVGDIIFDLLGASLVILFGERALFNVIESITDESAVSGAGRT